MSASGASTFCVRPPCPWAPLQSVATAASRQSHCGAPARVGNRLGCRVRAGDTARMRSRCRTAHPGVVDRFFGAIWGCPLWHRSRDARDALSALNRPLVGAAGWSASGGSSTSCRSGRRPRPSSGWARGLGGILRTRGQLVTSFTSSGAEAADSVRPRSGLNVWSFDHSRQKPPVVSGP